MGYQPKTYRKDGGDTLVIASGGHVEVASGGAVEVESGGAVEVESGGTLDIQQGALIKDTTKGISGHRVPIISKAALVAAAGSTGGKVLAWQGPTGTDVLITRFVLNITTASTQAGCVLDIGTATTSVTTKSNNLIDGLVATGTAALGVKDNVRDVGTDGRARQIVKAGKWITATSTGGAATALAGSAYVEYIAV